MRQVFLILFLLVANALSSQEALQEKVTLFKSNIAHSDMGEKLQWMDSLVRAIEFNEAFEYERTIKDAIAYGLKIDSLNSATKNTADLIYYKSSILGKPEEGLIIFNNFLGKEEGLKNYRTIANLYIYGGDCSFFMGDSDTGLKNYQIAYDYAIKSGDKNRVGVVNGRIGQVYSMQGLFAEASQTLQKASKVFVEAKDTVQIINSKNSLSILYSQNAFYEEARKERNEAIILSKKIGGMSLAPLYYNMAADYRMQGKNKEWISFLELALETNEQSQYRDYFRPNMLSNLVIAYASSDSLDKAKKYLKEVEEDLEANTTGTNRDYYIEALKQMEFAKGNYSKALDYGYQHLSSKREEDSYVEIYNAEKFLADVYEKLEDRNNANLHLTKYYAIKDSISNVQNVNALSYYQTLYETEKRDHIIENQEMDIALLDSKNRIKNQWLLFGGLGLLGVFGFIVILRSRNFARRKQKMQEEYSHNLIKAQEDERTRVARELHDSVGQKLMLLTKKTKTAGDASMEQLADHTLDELRSISRGLYPANLERLGLTKAIETMVNEVDANSNIFFTNDIENIDNLLSEEASLHVFRIIQEVLNNMVKHAQAKVASVSIERKDNVIEAIVQDNGRGFQISEKIKMSNSLGMKTLRERAKILKSKLEIRSEKDLGTTIELIVPLHNI